MGQRGVSSDRSTGGPDYVREARSGPDGVGGFALLFPARTAGTDRNWAAAQNGQGTGWFCWLASHGAIRGSPGYLCLLRLEDTLHSA
jgi:hypothetical protein